MTPPPAYHAGATQEDNARYLVQSSVYAWGEGIGDVLIYTEVEPPADAGNDARLGWMAMLDSNGSKRQIYYSWKKMADMIDGFTAVEKLSMDADIRGYKFTRGGQKIYVLWSKEGTGNHTDITLSIPEGRMAEIVRAVPDESGNFASELKNVVNAQIVLENLGETPLYVRAYTPSSDSGISNSAGAVSGVANSGTANTNVNNQNITGADTGTLNAAPTLDKNTGVANAKIDAAALNSALEKAVPNSDGVKTVNISISAIQGAMAYESALPANMLSSNSNQQILLTTSIAAITLPDNMLPPEIAAGAESVSISIAQVDTSSMDSGLRNQIGDKPVIELSLKVDGQPYSWNNDSAPVNVSIPYTPNEKELADPEHITVWYIDGSGNIIPVTSGKYDPSTGLVNFTTTHFSRYAVVFVNRTFKDLGNVSWAKKQIEVMASKGIINGVAENTFMPAGIITRADYMVLLVKTLGLSAKSDSNFDDVKPEAYYYKPVGIAKKLGIAVGAKNRFEPGEYISRQDMMVLAARAWRKPIG